MVGAAALAVVEAVLDPVLDPVEARARAVPEETAAAQLRRAIQAGRIQIPGGRGRLGLVRILARPIRTRTGGLTRTVPIVHLDHVEGACGHRDRIPEPNKPGNPIHRGLLRTTTTTSAPFVDLDRWPSVADRLGVPTPFLRSPTERAGP